MKQSKDSVAWDRDGLVPVVVQERHGGTVRMVAYADRAALETTLRTREAHFWSRSRRALWRKGETSGNVLRVAEVWLDCDGDTLLYLVDPVGPSCHTGRVSCFFQRLDADLDQDPDADGGAAPRPTLRRLEVALQQRVSADASRSYTRTLLDAGPAKVGAKLREEAGELADAIASESDDRVAAEASDLTYHMLAGLLLRRIPFRAVLETLAKRFGVSGIDEKASR